MDDMIEAEIWTISQQEGNGSVLLRLQGDDRVVPVFVGDAELDALLYRPGDPGSLRPRIHDLFMNFVEQSGFVVKRAEIYDLKKGIIHARMVFSQRDGGEAPALVLEALPSDAIALTLRAKTRLYVFRSVAARIGVPADVSVE